MSFVKLTIHGLPLTVHTSQTDGNVVTVTLPGDDKPSRFFYGDSMSEAYQRMIRAMKQEVITGQHPQALRDDREVYNLHQLYLVEKPFIDAEKAKQAKEEN